MEKFIKKEFYFLMELYTPRMQFRSGVDSTEILYEFWDQKNMGKITRQDGSIESIPSTPKIVAVILECIKDMEQTYTVHYLHPDTRKVLDVFLKGGLTTHRPFPTSKF